MAELQDGAMARSYRWRHFDDRYYDCTFQVSEQELSAAQAEFGIPREQRTREPEARNGLPAAPLHHRRRTDEAS